MAGSLCCLPETYITLLVGYTPIKIKLKKIVKVAQSCPTLCDPMDYIVHGILQARILEWVAFPFSRGSSQARDQTHVSCIAGRFSTSSVVEDFGVLLAVGCKWYPNNALP